MFIVEVLAQRPADVGGTTSDRHLLVTDEQRVKRARTQYVVVGRAWGRWAGWSLDMGGCFSDTHYVLRGRAIDPS